LWNSRQTASYGEADLMNTGTKKNREKLLAVIAAMVLASTAVFSIVIAPQLKKHKQLLEHKHQSQLKLTKMQGDLLIKDRIDSIYSQVEPLIAGNGTEQQEISLFTRQLGELYSKLKVKIRSVKILPSVNENFYRRLSIRIELSGNVKDVLQFICSIEASQNPLRIEQFELKGQETSDNIGVSMLVTKVVAEAKQ
jgi:Tfp pilus assembly protein PilO